MVELLQNISTLRKEVNTVFVLAWKSPLPGKNATGTKGPGGWMELDVITRITLKLCLEHLTLQKVQSAVPRVGKI